jgi:hypothetical protein
MSPGTVFAGAKVDVCHVPPGNPENFHTITISENALNAHLGHGDFEGACNANCASLCDDGNACTIDDTGDCAEVGCPLVPEPVDCNDSDPTTADSCEPAIGCINTPIITCPCEGTSGLGITWDDSFVAAVCGYSDEGGLLLSSSATAPTPTLGVLVDEIFGSSCGVGISQTGFNSRSITMEEVTACNESIRQIAANDGVTCP